MQYCCIIPNDELYHYGVKGMHWGIRRYQNANGTLTAEGKARIKEWKNKEIQRRSEGYLKTENRLNKRAARLMNKDGNRAAAKLEKTKLNIRINAEMKKAEIDKIKKMNINDIHQAKINKAKYATKKAFKILGHASITALGIGAGAGMIGAATELAGHSGEIITITSAAQRAARAAGVGALLLGGSASAIAGTKHGVRSVYRGFTNPRRYSNLTKKERYAAINRAMRR